MEQLTAIITGISGQDGAYLAQFLLQKKYDVIGITRSYSNSSLDGLKYLGIIEKIKIIECDLLDFSSILKLFQRYQPNEFYNLGAQSSVSLSFEQPIGTITYNSLSVLNILESIRILGLKTKVYQASSSEMYGRVSKLPINRVTPLHPVSPYAISKATAYWTIINYKESYNIFAVNGILFNHESYLRSNNFFVKKIIRAAINIKNAKQEFLRVGNIEIKRDFGYAPDYVKAMYLSLQTDQPDDYFICSGTSIRLRDIVEYVFNVFKISQNKIIVDKNLYRPSEIEDIYGDNSNAKIQLGWEYNKSFYEVLDILISEELKNFII